MTSTPIVIAGTGVDVVELDDVRDIRHKRRFAEYFLTKKEMAALPEGTRAAQFLGSRFAAKEAVIKAFPGHLTPHDFRITKKGCRPTVVFCFLKLRRRYAAHVSLTHTSRIAAAIAIVYRL